MPAELFTPLTLPNGSTLPNRLAKAAMEENMAAPGQVPGSDLIALYQRWSSGGVGLIITGNVMVHDAAMTEPGGIVLDAATPLEPFRKWAKAATSGGTKAWMQLNHPGRQVRANMPGVAWAPSAIRVDVGRNSRRFAEPTAMTEAQIRETVQRFVASAAQAQNVGFHGVEIHAAHGYLLSQFLSPLSNKRNDRWGGSLENRARLLTDIVRGIRETVRPDFAVAVKLNSSDFQRGGFEVDDARDVIAMLKPLGVDLVELSGGNYESPAMSGRSADDRTLAREAYFLELADELAATSPLPLMLTGGITRRSVAEEVLASSISIVGMCSALALDPQLPSKWEQNIPTKIVIPPVEIKDKSTASAADMARIRYQLRRLGSGKTPRPGINPRRALATEFLRQTRARYSYTAWLSNREQVLKSGQGSSGQASSTSRSGTSGLRSRRDRR